MCIHTSTYTHLHTPKVHGTQLQCYPLFPTQPYTTSHPHPPHTPPPPHPHPPTNKHSTGTTFVLPEARRLPAASVAAETIRCRLLEQHTSLYRRLEELTEAAGEDVTTLARLWQLQTKMGKAGAPYQVCVVDREMNKEIEKLYMCGMYTCVVCIHVWYVYMCGLRKLQPTTYRYTYTPHNHNQHTTTPPPNPPPTQPTTQYQVRAERVTKACAGLEQRLTKRLELIDGYARVLNMIEIEVELDTQVPDEEMLGIEQQIMRLEEVEELQEQWQLQAEAQEEVEKLLRAA